MFIYKIRKMNDTKNIIYIFDETSKRTDPKHYCLNNWAITPFTDSVDNFLYSSVEIYFQVNFNLFNPFYFI